MRRPTLLALTLLMALWGGHAAHADSYEPTVIEYYKIVYAKNNVEFYLHVYPDGDYRLFSHEEGGGGTERRGVLPAARLDQIDELFTPRKVAQYEQDRLKAVSFRADERKIRYARQGQDVNFRSQNPSALSADGRRLIQAFDLLLIELFFHSEFESFENESTGDQRCLAQP